MKKLWPTLLVLAALIFPFAHAIAWNGTGHMTVAAIAYRGLPDDAKKKVDALLQEHPDYARWKQGLPGEDTSMDLGLYIFMRASTWPDDIRRSGNPYDHPQWHFVDYPLKSPWYSVLPSPTPDDDILYGIQQCEDILGDDSVPATTRAAYLSWLIHLLGDIHQPLHCATLVNGTYPPPQGDKGGNNFYVRPAQKAVKLHSFWDGLLGTEKDPRLVLNAAIAIQSEHDRESLGELKQATNPKAWSLESRKIALETTYQRGHLEGSDHAADAPSLPEGYAKTAKSVAQRRVALAGYRLTDEIQTLLQQ